MELFFKCNLLRAISQSILCIFQGCRRRGGSWKRKQTRKHLTFWGAGRGSIFHKTWGSRNVKAEAVKFLWKRKLFEEKSWKRKKTRKRLTLYGVGRSKKYSTASTSLVSFNLHCVTLKMISVSRSKCSNYLKTSVRFFPN